MKKNTLTLEIPGKSRLLDLNKSLQYLKKLIPAVRSAINII